MKTAIIVDSTGGLSEEMLDLPNVFCVNLSIRFENGDIYYDTSDQKEIEGFYKQLPKEDVIPLTSQPEPSQYIEILDEIVEEGFENAIFIMLSANLSGTFQTAKMIGADYEDKLNLYYLDTTGTSYLIDQLARDILKELEENPDVDLDQLVEDSRWRAQKANIYVVVEDLHYLVKGGRLNVASAVIGSLLSVKAILKIGEDGRVVPFERVRTRKKVKARYLELMEEEYNRFNGEVDLFFAHSDDEAFMNEMIEAARIKFPDIKIRSGYLTPIIGVHAGRGALGFGMLPKRNLERL